MDQIIDIIRNGGLVIMPTDTVYGIIGDATNENTIKKVYDIKKRDFNKPLLMLVNGIDMLKEYVDNLSSFEREIIDNYWPGPVTIVFKKNNKVSDILSAGMDTVGVRFPDNKLLIDIISKINKPLLSTSVNISGKSEVTNPNFIDEEIINSIDFIMDCGVCDNIASSVIKCKDGKIIVLRKGEKFN